ncbi:MAG: hypothetical protein IJX78_06225 [Bacilli bacterium]|nr:hypothetical protein [Bacilli bacterium]
MKKAKKGESIILLCTSIFAIVLSSLVLFGDLEIDEKIIKNGDLFGWILFGIGVFSAIYASACLYFIAKRKNQ